MYVSTSSRRGLGALSAVLINVSRGAGSPFYVGDNYRLELTGKPNQPVFGSAIFGGKDMGTTPFGSTDSAGRRVINGQFTPDTEGNWFETWKVGDETSTLQFTVGRVSFSPAPAPPAAPQQPAAPPPAPPAARPVEQASTILGMSASTVLWAAVALALGFAVFGKGGR